MHQGASSHLHAKVLVQCNLLIENNQSNNRLNLKNVGSVCFGFKLILEMIFRKSGCLVGPENWVKRKITSVDRKMHPLIL